jgi:hypothetical protein
MIVKRTDLFRQTRTSQHPNRIGRPIEAWEITRKPPLIAVVTRLILHHEIAIDTPLQTTMGDARVIKENRFASIHEVWEELEVEDPKDYGKSS